MSKALFFGTLALDDIELPSIHLEKSPGGSAGYGSMAAALFSPVLVSSVVGKDFPKKYLDLMKSKGVDLSLVQKSAKLSSRWRARYSDDLSDVKTLLREYNAFEDYDPMRLANKVDDVGAAFLSKNDPELQLEIIKLLPEKATVIVESRGAWITEKRAKLIEVLQRADVYYLDEWEASLLVGGDTPVPEMIEKVMHMGPKVVVFKRGEHGLVMYGQKGTMIVPPYPLAYAIDPTGAGDVLGGGVAGVLAKLEAFDDDCMKTALILASITSSFVVEDYATEALHDLNLEEVVNRSRIFLKQLPNESEINMKKVVTNS
jgi:sugar/nucleoside kinase (ribokinase family)